LNISELLSGVDEANLAAAAEKGACVLEANWESFCNVDMCGAGGCNQSDQS